jgi:hypothetical protein
MGQLRVLICDRGEPLMIERKLILLAVLFAMHGCSFPGAQRSEQPVVEIRFDPTVRFQTMEGWGARFPAPKEGEPLAEVQRALVQDLGLTRFGIELTTWDLLGLPEGADPPEVDMSRFDFARIDRYAHEVVQPLREMVHQRGERFIFYLTVVWTTWPSVMHRDPAEYAKYLLAVLRRFRAAGVEVDYWVIENEPDFRTGPFWTPDKLGRFIAYLGDRMRAEGFRTKFAAPEVVRPGNVGKWLGGLVAVPGARQYLGLITYHSYDYDPSIGEEPPSSTRISVAQWARRLGLPVAQTEQGALGKSNHERWYGRDMGLALDLASNVWADLVWAGVSAWEPHVVFTKKEDGNRWVGGGFFQVDKASGTILKQHHYWALRQFTRFLQPGAVRVQAMVSNSGSDVRAVGFLSPSGNPGLILVNPGSSPVSVRIRGLTPGPFRSAVTTLQSLGVEAEGAPAVAGESYLIQLPSEAVLTLWRP